jgi:hypothetical protein
LFVGFGSQAFGAEDIDNGPTIELKSQWEVMKKLVLVALALAVLPLLAKVDEDTSGRHKADDTLSNGFDSVILRKSTSLFNESRHIFRYDTFGDEVFWGDALKLHLALAGTNNGGVGSGVSPRTAFAAGLKLDVQALPPSLQAELQAGNHCDVLLNTGLTGPEKADLLEYLKSL